MPDKNSYEPSVKKSKVEVNLNNPVKQEIVSDETSQQEPPQQLPRVQDQLLPTVQLFGSEVPYRRCGKILLFNTAAVVDIVRSWLPLAADLQLIVRSLQVAFSCNLNIQLNN